ncbi:GerMN domain-containing protein [Mahella australiensis]|uniref:Lipoprotein LpqB, GerMN domain protein n=1 Tax=Mahella australiensis (strain DSM 15567 / CIP 107919 / 50-1 BON) TaxID=697281 RepID=F4A1Y9_MAHA5|nr:GerMN domain-containing protein [Mahella australiensis]AEE96105.1 Lipoprotein LpqB, GerMN domain protein [Mahella australiensis 50-1 BON]
MHSSSKITMYIKLLTICLIIVLSLSSCDLFGQNVSRDDAESAPIKSTRSSPIPISPDLEQYDVDITLYFLSEDGTSLVPERRTIKKGPERLEELVVSELIKGPMQRGHVAIIPPATKLLSVTSSDNIAFVDVSKDFLSIDQKEPNKLVLMIYSVVNTITELDGIDKVQFLVEGQKAPIFPEINGQNPKGNVQSGPIARANSLIQSPVTAVNSFLKALSANDLDKAYIYMSDDMNDKNKRSLQEFKDAAKQINFKLTDYAVYDYSLDLNGNEALVSVDFEIKLGDGSTIKRDKALLKTVRLNGIWKLEWALPFEDLQLEMLNAIRK